MATKEEIEAEIVLLKEDLTLVRVAIRQVLLNQSYTLDTSQTRQVVTKADLSSLRLLRDQIREDIKELEADLGDVAGTTSKTSRIIPGW